MYWILGRSGGVLLVFLIIDNVRGGWNKDVLGIFFKHDVSAALRLAANAADQEDGEDPEHAEDDTYTTSEDKGDRATLPRPEGHKSHTDPAGEGLRGKIVEGAMRTTTGGAIVCDQHGVGSDKGEDLDVNELVLNVVVSGLVVSRYIVPGLMMSGFVMSRLVVAMVAVMLMVVVVLVMFVPVSINELHPEGLPEYVRDVNHLLSESTAAHPVWVRIGNAIVGSGGGPVLDRNDRGAGDGVAET